MEDALVEEHQGIHGLVLGGGSDVSIHCQVGEERLDLGFGGEEVYARPHAVETDESHNPFHIGSLSVDGVVVQPEHVPHFIEEFWWLTSCRVRHRRLAPWRPEIADNRHRAKLPENRPNITLSRQIVKLINGSAQGLCRRGPSMSKVSQATNYDLVIVAESPDTEIWLGDNEGYFV
jgi:hypothetical protein